VSSRKEKMMEEKIKLIPLDKVRDILRPENLMELSKILNMNSNTLYRTMGGGECRYSNYVKLCRYIQDNNLDK
jgi:predicted transcriptional regulator